MRRHADVWFLGAYAAALLLAGAQGTEYYVSPNGSDANAGTADLPWLTIQKAADTLAAGDTVYVRAGTYKEQVQPRNSGTYAQYISYSAYQNDVVILDGENTRPPSAARWGALFYISGQSYIRVSGLRAINSTYAGFLAEQNAHHIVFERNSTFQTWSSGISVWGCANITIDGNDIQKACQGASGPVEECISVASTDTFEIKNNHVYDRLVGAAGAGGEGLCVKQASKNGRVFGNRIHDLVRIGLYVDGWDSTADTIEVYGNLVYNTQAGVALSAELSSGALKNVRVDDNVVHDNTEQGIIITDYNQEISNPDGPKQNITIINNTVYHNGYNSINWGGGITVTTNNPATSGLLIRNNICSQNNRWQIMRNSNIAGVLTVDYNLIDGDNSFADGADQAVAGTNAVLADPAFVSTTTPDFHLLASSPAIDAGSIDAAPAFDFDGLARPTNGGKGNITDIGAYEYQPAAAPVVTSPLAASGAVGQQFTYAIIVSGTPPITFTASPLPDGLALNGATISGTPSAAGVTTVTLTAANSFGSDSKNLLITITVAGGSGSDSDGDGFPDELEVGYGSSPTDPSSTPFGGAPAGPPVALAVKGLAISLNFARPGRDSITISGAAHLAAGFVVANHEAVLDIGGVVRKFSLDPKGSGKSGNDSFRLQVRARRGVVPEQDAAFRATLKGDLTGRFADEGLVDTDARNEPKTIGVILLLNPAFFQKGVGVLYNARANKSGRAK